MEEIRFVYLLVSKITNRVSGPLSSLFTEPLKHYKENQYWIYLIFHIK